ncbi:MAG: glycosyl transferase [Stutzerimonas stutzeri]|uniref:Glycosyltransferase family 4 protein n=1 Tax=Bosea eneae TaxID=151454 RepID=A0ABW0IZC0_9HYPH|nr:MAG: glycosyl transferase [Stutzerimonas stutzeri]
MKVALFVHCFFPEHFYGTETYTLGLAKNLQALGHDVTVVAGVFQGEPRRQAIIEHSSFDGVPVVTIDKNYVPHSRVRETYFQEEMRPHLTEILREIAPDIVHVTHLINHTAVLLEVANQLDIPLVATLTDFFGFCYNNKLEAADGVLCAGPNRLRSNCIACHLKAAALGGEPRAKKLSRIPYGWHLGALALRAGEAFGWPRVAGADAVVSDIVDRPRILARAYRGYDAMIAPTHFLRDAYVRNGFSDQHMSLLRFGVDIDRSPKPVRAPATPLTIGFIGQIAAHKGTSLIVQAARALPPGSVRLIIYGPADQDPDYMRSLRQAAGPETEFRGTFAPERMAAVMAEMDILAIPSTWYENSPLVLLNALATHTPVLVSDVQGLTEFITEGRDGWSFRRSDLADLTRVMAGLAANPEVVQAASANTVYDRTTRSMATEVGAIYASLVRGRLVKSR